jgi:hypothetical protein
MAKGDQVEPGGKMTATTFKPKKSVALSGVEAGTTALCTVGRSEDKIIRPTAVCTGPEARRLQPIAAR